MKYTPRIDASIRLASRLHREQTRMDKDKSPYISHLVSVAMLLSEHTDDDEIIIAGLMHDSLEDVPGYTYEKLIQDSGQRVALIVKHVTEPLDANKSKDEQLPWLTRKQAYLKNLEEGGTESALVSLCDKLHNTLSFISDMKAEGEEFTKRFGSSIKNKIWFNEEVIKIASTKLKNDHPLIQKLTLATDQLRTTSKEYKETT
jgi:(p)ppGpp synthase/HD superfamily hydrolase